MESIVQMFTDRCFLCGGPAEYNDPLDCHHCFGGANRKKSEKYGLKVYLHHSRCHIFGRKAVHQNREKDLFVKQAAQKAAMQQYGWTEDEFRQIFGKNYL